jgi:UDP-glucose 4-epimerase
LGWFVRQAMDGEEIAIWGDGQQVRDYTYVDDVVEAFLKAGVTESANGLVINLGGLRPISHLELVQTLIEVVGRGSYRLAPFPDERRRIDIGDVYSSRDLARDTLGWEPTTELRDGLARTVAYLSDRRAAYW